MVIVFTIIFFTSNRVYWLYEGRTIITNSADGKDWYAYLNEDQIQKLTSWLTTKGVRENSLLKAIKGVRDKFGGGFEDAYCEWCIQREDEDAEKDVEMGGEEKAADEEEKREAEAKDDTKAIPKPEEGKKDEVVVVDLFNDQLTGEAAKHSDNEDVEMEEDPAEVDARKAALGEKRLASLRMALFGLADAMPRKFLRDPAEGAALKEELCGRILDANAIPAVAELVLRFYDLIDPAAFEGGDWAGNAASGSAGGRAEWWWTREVREVQTLSQLAVVIEHMDAACPWALRCHVCRKKFCQCRYVTCFNCAHSFHLNCAKPALPRVPPGDWFCGDCKAVEKELLAKSQDVCYACGKAGKLLCCDSCPKVFHLACCGLAKLPKGDWHCAYCTQKNRGGSATFLPPRKAKARCIEANAELTEYERSGDKRDRYSDTYGGGDDDDDGQKAERPYKRLKRTRDFDGDYDNNGDDNNDDDDDDDDGESDGLFDEFRKGHFLRKRTHVNYNDAYNTRMMAVNGKGSVIDDEEEGNDEKEDESGNIRRLQYGLRLRPRKKYSD